MHIEAIVIRKRPVREYDQLVVLYSRELGKMTALAKGSLRGQSTQALALDEASTIRCRLVYGKSSPIMTGAQSVRSLGDAKRSTLAWAAVQFFLQAADAVVFDAQPDEALWSCLQGTLSELDKSHNENVLQVYREGQRRLLGVLGYGQPAAFAEERWMRNAMDDQFEVIAQRKLSAIDLLYDIAVMSRS